MTINLNTWKHFLNENKQLDELTKKSRKAIKDYIKDDVAQPHKPKYSFDHLFPNDDMRQVIPMEIPRAIQGMMLFRRMTKELGWEPNFGTKTITQKQRQPDGKTVEISKKVPDLKMYKIEKKTIPSGPRAGEKIEKEIEINLGKLVSKEGTEDEKRWWKENQNTLRDRKNVFNWFVHPYENNFKMASPPVIVLSRHPMDVARMSDFSMTRSCHSEGRGQFHCAMAEAKGYGMVAFLINGPDWEAYKLKDKLQDDEIFGDSDIGLDGPEPIARVRLRKLYNKKTGQEFATVENSVYGSSNPDFLPTVRKWARDKQEGVIDIEDGKVTALDPNEWVVLGGSYMDNNPSQQIIGMWKGTDLEGQVKDAFSGIYYRYQRKFDPKRDMKIREIEGYINDMLENISISLYSSNGRIRIQEPADLGSFKFPNDLLKIKTTDGQFNSIEKLDDYLGKNEKAIETSILKSIKDYFPDNPLEVSLALYKGRLEVDVYQADGIPAWNEISKILSQVASSANPYGRSAPRSLELITASQHFRFIDSIDKNYDNIKNIIYRELEKFSILKKSPFTRTALDLKKMTLPNLEIDYEESAPEKGIIIKNAKTIPVATLPLRGPGQDGVQGIPLSREIRSKLENDVFRKAILEKFKTILNEMRAKAAKQLTPSGVKPAEAYGYTIPESMEVDLFIDSVDNDQDKINMGLSFYIELPYSSSEDQMMSTISFLKVLNNNIDALVKNNADSVAKLLWQMSYDKAKSQNLQESARNYFSKFGL